MRSSDWWIEQLDSSLCDFPSGKSQNRVMAVKNACCKRQSGDPLSPEKLSNLTNATDRNRIRNKYPEIQFRSAQLHLSENVSLCSFMAWAQKIMMQRPHSNLNQVNSIYDVPSSSERERVLRLIKQFYCAVGMCVCNLRHSDWHTRFAWASSASCGVDACNCFHPKLHSVWWFCWFSIVQQAEAREISLWQDRAKWRNLKSKNAPENCIGKRFRLCLLHTICKPFSSMGKFWGKRSPSSLWVYDRVWLWCTKTLVWVYSVGRLDKHFVEAW